MYDNNLRYGQLWNWDAAMNKLETRFGSMIHPHQYVTLSHEEDKLIAFEKGHLVYIFNFHPNNSYSDFRIGTFWKSDHFVVLESDQENYGGF